MGQTRTFLPASLSQPAVSAMLPFLLQPYVSCSSPGLTGSLAIVGGYWLHISPYGNLHWNPDDLLVGMTCILPLLLLGEASD